MLADDDYRTLGYSFTVVIPSVRFGPSDTLTTDKPPLLFLKGGYGSRTPLIATRIGYGRIGYGCGRIGYGFLYSSTLLIEQYGYIYHRR